MAETAAVRRRAIISDCGRYRYALGRSWEQSVQSLVFCMLNPSTADAEQDDPTIRRCMGFARANGYGGIVVVNLFAFRATNPRDIPEDVWEAAGPENMRHLADMAYGRDVVVAWGANERATAAVTSPSLEAIRSFASKVYCLGVTKSGAPRHPLYVRGDQSLTPYVERAA